MTLTIAVPSKGRLQENTQIFFAKAGLSLVSARGARDYRGTISGLSGVEIAYLSASEIVQELASGNIHLGVTGEDLIRESIPDADSKVTLLQDVGFGQANVVVAVPQAWIDVRTMSDLDDVTSRFYARHKRKMRVATKYINLTRQYFSQHAILDYRIVESLGATEGTPAAGTADLIVDITTTGTTLAANGLKVLEDGIILRSSANLVASLKANWEKNTLATCARIFDRITAMTRAQKLREVRTRFAALDQNLLEQAKKRFAVFSPFGGPTSSGMLTLHCPIENLQDLALFLRENGAQAVSVGTLDYVFTIENPLYERLVKKIT